MISQFATSEKPNTLISYGEDEREWESKHVLFTAGAAVLMSCLKRFILMVFLMEQWRAWVFLLLNLVLLAIVFTSISSGTSNTDRNRECENNAEGFKRNEGAKRREYRCPLATRIVERVKVCEDEVCKRSASGGGESEQERVEDDTEGEEVRKLSKEDLNERVEAFIVMFRQHLVSDARN